MVTTEKQDSFRTIGNVAERVGVSLTTLRLMEAQAGIQPYRTDTNLRLYDEAMIVALCDYRDVQRAKKVGRAPERDESA